MSEFDPYHKWLGIPRNDQPPHHYRLLGIELFESDPDVIDAATEQRASFVRQCATGQHMAESQKLLNEIAIARLCLLNAAQRQEYDRALRTKLNPVPPVVFESFQPEAKLKPFSVSAVEPTPVGDDSEEESPDDLELAPVLLPRQRPVSQQRSAKAKAIKLTNSPAVMWGGLGAVATVVLLFIVFRGNAATISATPSAVATSKSPTPMEPPEAVAKLEPPKGPAPVEVAIVEPATTPQLKKTVDPLLPPAVEPLPAKMVEPAANSRVDNPSPLPQEITSKSTGMKLTLIPAGTFQMGSPDTEVERESREGPQHMVRISQPFYMGMYEVTQGEYEQVMGTNPSALSKSGSRSSAASGQNTSRFPVEQVSWNDAVKFCEQLSAKDGVTYRLPTEAEWEYACRAGTTTPFHFGRTLNETKANVNGNSPYSTTPKGKYLNRTTTVGSYSKNDFGLFDMHGNVFEWCEDVYDADAYAARTGMTNDPLVMSGSREYVVRGGGFNCELDVARSAKRTWDSPNSPSGARGFRVVFPSSIGGNSATTIPTRPTRQPPPPNEFTSKLTGMKLALIPAGTFTMGSPAGEADRHPNESPTHMVRISQPFYMGVYEVTQGEYESVMGTNPSFFSKSGGGSGKVSGQNTSRFPVEQVSWNDAVEFCEKLSAKDGVTYRLPTEAEWEYACRANTTTAFHFGSVLNGDKANVDGESPYGTTTKGLRLGRTTTVGSYPKNAFGLFDMHGNVSEWCEDLYDEKAYASRSGTMTDPKVRSESKYRVLRGGSWNYGSMFSRSASRLRFTPVFRNYVGFRVVISSSAVRTP